MIREALDYLGKHLEQAREPALLLSGGKESTLLLEMCRRAKRVPYCIYWHEDVPEDKQRHFYVEWLALEYDLMVVNWPARYRTMIATDTGIDLLAGYPVGGSSMVLVGREVLDRGEQNLRCGLDWLGGPVAEYPNCPFDLLIHGGRREDDNPVFGRLTRREYQLGRARVIHPLLNWGEIDVWTAIDRLDAPYHKARYDRGADGEHPDLVSMCARCVDPHLEGDVFCSKVQAKIPAKSVAVDWPLHHARLRSLVGDGGGTDADDGGKHRDRRADLGTWDAVRSED